MEISIPVSAPGDDDGFIRRQCPTCSQQFKWRPSDAHDATISESPELAKARGDSVIDVNQYFCPICGEPADVTDWNTPEQVEAALSAAAPEISAALQEEIARSLRDVKGLTFDPNRDFEVGIPAAHVSHEPNDMNIAVPPCHPSEPVKVFDLRRPLHCLVCGAKYAV